MAVRLRHQEVEAIFNKLSQDRQQRPWKRGRPDAEAAESNSNAAADPKVPAGKAASGPEAGSGPQTDNQPTGRQAARGNQKNKPTGAATKQSDDADSDESAPQNPNLFRFQKPKSNSNPNGTRKKDGFWVPMD